MAKQNIELHIGSTFSGEGFQKLDRALKSSAGSVGKTAKTVGDVAAQFENMSGSLGKFAGTASKLLGGFLSMGVWGAVIAAATSLFGILKDLVHPVDKVTEGFRQQLKHLKSLDYMAEQYAKRIQKYKDAARELEQAEKSAAEASQRAEEQRKKNIEESWRLGRQYEGLQAKIEEEETKLALTSKDQNEVLKARIKLIAQAANAEVNDKRMALRGAQDLGNGTAIDIAQKELELAIKKRAVAKEQARAMIEAAENAKQREKDTYEEMLRKMRAEDMAKEAAEKKRLEYEKAIAKVSEDAENKKKAIEDEIARMREEAVRLEENASRARGKSVGDWERGERELARQQRKEERQQAGRMKNAERELDRLEKMNPKLLTDGQKKRMSRLREWIADQDPKNNPALKKIEELQAKRDQIAKESRDLLKQISDTFKAATT